MFPDKETGECKINTDFQCTPSSPGFWTYDDNFGFLFQDPILGEYKDYKSGECKSILTCPVNYEP